MTEQNQNKPFWETKSLSDMTTAEWESLCDGCGRCCLLKLEDEDTGRIYYTDVGCKLLDCESCQCTNYPDRLAHVPDCVVLNPQKAKDLNWMPSTCAYRLLANNQPLPEWHPLVSGNAESVHWAGMSVANRIHKEDDIAEDDLPNHLVHWPA
ncbi:MAG: YcgN family cysteine cluster protein [Alphaproteobacteria bacterium]